MNGLEKAAESPAKDQRTGLGSLMRKDTGSLPSRDQRPVDPIDSLPAAIAHLHVSSTLLCLEDLNHPNQRPST